MGVPDFDPRSLPFEAPREGTLPSGSRRPHARTSRGLDGHRTRHHVASVEAAPVATSGLRSSAIRLPKRVNAGFLEIVAPRSALRVYERGAGETLAAHRRLRRSPWRRAGCSQPVG